MRFSTRERQQRPEIGDRRAYRVPLGTEDVPEDGREAGEPGCLRADQLEPVVELGRGCAGMSQPGEITLDVRHEDRDADAGEALCSHLQGHRLPSPSRPRDDAVPVGERRQEVELEVA